MDKSEAKEEAAVAEATKNLLYWVCTQDLRYYMNYEGSERIHIQANVFLKPA